MENNTKVFTKDVIGWIVGILCAIIIGTGFFNYRTTKKQESNSTPTENKQRTSFKKEDELNTENQNIKKVFISGKITDFNSKKSISNVDIYLNDKKITSTNDNGYFEYQGNHESTLGIVNISYYKSGYLQKTFERRVYENTKNIDLRNQKIELKLNQ